MKLRVKEKKNALFYFSPELIQGKAHLCQSIFKGNYLHGDVASVGTSASRLDKPDVGLLTMSEMVEQARNMAEAVDIPVVADGDTGYGNAIYVMRTVREYEKAGVACIQL